MSAFRQRPVYVDVSPTDFTTLPGLTDWRYASASLVATFRAPSFLGAASLVQRIAVAAEEADHHPDIGLRYPAIVRVSLTTHDVGGVTMHDVALARVISSLAAAAGSVAAPASSQ